MGDTKVGVLGFRLDAFDSLNGVRDVGKVDESAISNVKQHQVRKRPAHQRGGKHVLLLQIIHKLDLSILAEVLLKLLNTEPLEVFDIANINITSSTGLNGQSKGRRKWARVLAPANLQTTIVERESRGTSSVVEYESGSRFDEGNEL